MPFQKRHLCGVAKHPSEELGMVIGNRFFVVVDSISLLLLAFQCFYYSLALFISWWISSFASAFRFTLMYPHNSHCILCECEILFHIFFSRLSLSKSTQKKYIWVFFVFTSFWSAATMLWYEYHLCRRMSTQITMHEKQPRNFMIHWTFVFDDWNFISKNLLRYSHFIKGLCNAADVSHTLCV